MDNTDKVTYKTSDKSIATVSDTGLVTAIGEGTAIITVTAGEQTATSTITIQVTTTYKKDSTQSESRLLFTIGDIGNPYLVVIKNVTDKSKVTGAKIILTESGKITPLSLYDGSGTTLTQFTKDGRNTVGLGIPKGKITFGDITDKTKIVVIAKFTANSIHRVMSLVITKADKGDIYSWRDLDRVRDNLSGAYTLKNDIKFPEDNTYGYGTSFTPIGNDNTKFSGKLDGGGFTIGGLKISKGNANFIGLFGYVAGTTAEIKNLIIDHVGIAGYNNVGSLVGKVDGSAKITNVG
jgi:hypothetical protein